MARTRNTLLSAGIRGSVGDATFVQGATGTQLRRRPVRVGPPTPAQRDSALRMETISAWWAQVDLAGVEAWRAYALSLEAGKPALERRPMPSWNAFLALATRVLMVDPGAEVPLHPPAAAFAGDAVAVTVVGEGTPHPYPSPPEGRGVRFVASRPNAPGVVTELMLQRLASVARAPVPSRYRSQAFVGFTEGGLEAVVPQAPGWVACAVRFVDARTGQATAVFPCGIVGVGV